MAWTFRQFISASGRESIADWRRKTLTPKRRATMDVFLKRIASMREWPTGICDPLTGHPGFWELRWTAEKVEHRIFGYYEGNSFVMLVGCTHKGRVYDPPGAFTTLQDRYSKIKRGEGRIGDYTVRAVEGDEGQGISTRPDQCSD